MIFQVETFEQWEKLKEYETKACIWCECVIMLESGEVLQGSTFIRRGDPKSKELEDGAFVLEDGSIQGFRCSGITLVLENYKCK